MSVLVYLLSCLTFVSAGSHSLMAFATYIDGQTPFPEFSLVLMLDDVQIVYYDSTTWKPVYRSHSESKYYDEEQMLGKVTQRLQISCLATVFYPCHINLILFRDGQPVDDDQITGGEILPNGDGTYQMRNSLLISEEELHEKHKYNCSMKRLNLDNKLDITFDVGESDTGYFSPSVVFSVLMFMCLAVCIIAALIIWRKRRSTCNDSVSRKSQRHYVQTQTQDAT
ncbi:hypothetical protein QQF64_031929 [Cirrhinus molitorella]|uniref:Immunoglobulin C1-set domain-containing protein n=1 Tax=Cirrhinus molitorella TaxID=172907 RepID=A0ABR3MYD9_9TELE